MKAPAHHPPRGVVRRVRASRPLVDDPRRAPTPVACVEDFRQAQSHLQAAASLIRGTVRSGGGLDKTLAEAADAAAVLARTLDAEVHRLLDLADPRRGVR